MGILCKRPRCLIENVTEKCPCLKLKRLPKWYNSLYYDKLSEGLIPDSIKSYKEVQSSSENLNKYILSLNLYKN
jgi:hypothetical protein